MTEGEETSKRKLNIFTQALRNDAIDDFFNFSVQLYQECQTSKCGLIKHRRHALKQYKSCFKGDAFVSYLIEVGHASSRVEGCAIGCSMLMLGVLHNVCDDHHFKDEPLFYRFRKDDGTYQGDLKPFRQAAVQAVRLHGILRAKHPKMIASRDFGVFAYQKCLVASHLIDWLVEHGKCKTRTTAIDLCRRMQSFKLIDHVNASHVFQDKYLFFRFSFDALQADKGFLEFTKMEQGLSYLGHLDRSSTPPDNPTRLPVPQSTTNTTTTHTTTTHTSTSNSTSDSDTGSANSLALKSGFDANASYNKQQSERDDNDNNNNNDNNNDADDNDDDAVVVVEPTTDSESDASWSPRVATLQRSSSASPSVSLSSLAGSLPAKARKLDQIWYHGQMNRQAVATIFEAQDFANGRWLVRDYRNNPKNFVLSVTFETEIYHIVISCKEDMYRIDHGPGFDSVQGLTMFYQSARAQKEVPTPLVEYIAYRPQFMTPQTTPPPPSPTSPTLPPSSLV